MRLIDADALKDGYMHMGYDPNEHPEESYMEGWCKGFNAAVDHCIGHVIHAPTIEPEQKWIPVSERLPEDDTEVLVYLFDRRSPYIAWVTDCCWFTEDFEVEKENYPTAWMPLPEPYREEGGK